MKKYKAIEGVHSFWINVKLLKVYRIIEKKLKKWIRLISILNLNKSFEVKDILLNVNKQKLNFATYRQPYMAFITKLLSTFFVSKFSLTFFL